MTTTVKLGDIIDGMESQSFDNLVLLNNNTGEVVLVIRGFLQDAEDDKPFDHLPEWQQEQMELAYDILDHEEKYSGLPSEFDIDEYQMIETFCFTVKNQKKQERLLRAIKGKGAFRRFKDLAFDLDVIEDWYSYRDKCYRQIAIDYCEEKGIDWAE